MGGGEQRTEQMSQQRWLSRTFRPDSLSRPLIEPFVRLCEHQQYIYLETELSGVGGIERSGACGIEPVPIGLVSDNFDFASFRSTPQHGRDTVCALEFLVVFLEQLQNLTGRQRSVRIGFLQNRADPLELAAVYAHAYVKAFHTH